MSSEDPATGVTTARAKFSCAACGADAHWNPAKQALICPFCGAETPVDRKADSVAEHDLWSTLRSAPGAAPAAPGRTRAVRCQSCQAVSELAAERDAQRCEFCGSAQLVPSEEPDARFRPESLLPFAVPEPQARERLRTWIRGLWFAPNALARQALTDTVHGMYLPYWTFDAAVDAHWTAESGEHYYVGTGKQRQRRTRWTHCSGSLSHVFDDELEPASKGVRAGLLRDVEPFPTQAVVAYDASYVAGWTVERYQIDLERAAATARQRMRSEIERMCAARVPGDTHRSLQVDAAFSGERFKHVLLPVWLVTYDWGARSFQAVVNGATGNVSGERPWSAIKIALAALAVGAVLYGFYLAHASGALAQ